MRFRITPTLTQIHQIHSNASNKWYKQHWRSQFRKQPPMLSHVLKYLLPKIRKDLLTASLSTHRWVYELWLFLEGFGFIQIKKSNLAQPCLQVLTYHIASLTSPISANLIPTSGADYTYPQHCYWHPQIFDIHLSGPCNDKTIFRPIHTYLLEHLQELSRLFKTALFKLCTLTLSKPMRKSPT